MKHTLEYKGKSIEVTIGTDAVDVFWSSSPRLVQEWCEDPFSPVRRLGGRTILHPEVGAKILKSREHKEACLAWWESVREEAIGPLENFP